MQAGLHSGWGHFITPHHPDISGRISMLHPPTPRQPRGPIGGGPWRVVD